MFKRGDIIFDLNKKQFAIVVNRVVSGGKTYCVRDYDDRYYCIEEKYMRDANDIQLQL